MVKDLIAQRVKLNEDARGILEKAEKEKRALTAEERETVKRMEGEIRDLKGKIDAEAQAVEEERDLRAALEAEGRELAESRGRRTQSETERPTNLEEDRNLAFRGWCLGRRATNEQRAAAQRVGMDLAVPFIDMASSVRRDDSGHEVRTFFPCAVNSRGDIDAAQTRALSIGTTTAGGNAVPNEMMRAYHEVQKWYGRARESAQVINTETGATLPWPTVTDTSNTGEILAEATTATTTADPTFGVVNLSSFKFSSKAVLVSWELLQDSFIPLASYLGTALGRRIGRIQNNKFTVGAGTTEPKGFVTGSSAGVTSASTNAFTLDNVIDLIHSLDLAYRNLPDTAFQVHDSIAAYLRKFKTGDGEYIWQMSTQLGQPDRLFGYPVSINNDMSGALTTGLKVLVFGNLKLAFLVRDAGAVRFVRSDEKYILEHQVMFEASQRSDSNVIDSTAIKHLVLA